MTNGTCSRSRFGEVPGGLVRSCQCCGAAQLSRLADLAAFANPAWPVKLWKLLLEGLPDLFAVCRD